MKRIIIFLIAFFVFHFAFTQWHWQNCTPQGNHINDMVFINDLEGWLVGNSGTIMHSLNGGFDWSYQECYLYRDLLDLEVLDESRLWITGTNGLILHSNDGGLFWEQQNSGSNENLTSICFTDSIHGWIAGSKNSILKTVDGGIIWIPFPLGSHNPNHLCFSVFFVDSLNGWGAAPEVLYKSTNGGLTWHPNLYAFPMESFWDVHFIDTNYGWIISDWGNMLITPDGGSTWSPSNLVIPAFSFSYPNSLFFTDTLNGWIVACNQMIKHSSDGGYNWTLQHSNNNWSDFLSSIWFIDSNTGWAAGDEGDIFKTNDAGSNWTNLNQRYGSTSRLNDVYFNSRSNGMAVGNNGTFLTTTDTGWHWSADSIIGPDLNLYSICFPDELHGFIGGETGLFLRTSDGGNSWETDFIHAEANLTDVFFVDQNNGWVIGDYWCQYDHIYLILNTSDGGISWNTQLQNEYSDLNSIYFTDLDNGWAVGSLGWMGLFLHTTNGGEDWEQMDNPPMLLPQKILILGNGVFLVIGRSGIMKSLDDGVTWWDISPGNCPSLLDIVFIDDLNGWVGGVSTGYMLNTMDGGDTWNKVNCRAEFRIYSIFFVDDSYGWAVGGHGTILHTINGSGDTTNIDSRYSRRYVNLNIQPNPLSTCTEFEFAIGNNATVEFRIYNINGIEVDKITTKTHNNDINRVRWTPGNLPNGIYFVELIGAEVIASGKMIVVK